VRSLPQESSRRPPSIQAGLARVVKRFAVAFFACVVVAGCAEPAESNGSAAAVLDHVVLPPGFTMELVTDQVPNARSLALGDRGTLFVGTRSAGKVYAVNGIVPGDTARVTVISDGLNMPNGVAFRDGALYVAEVNRILRFDGIESRLDENVEPTVLVDDYPSDRHHGWKYIAFGPDGRLYVPIGAPCNVCDQPGYAVITRMNVDGSGREVFARGVRNTVGFTWHPATREFWFTDNGRDWMGDDLPPCELNRAASPGLDFGFPRCHGANVVDPEFGKPGACSDSVPPVQELGAHVAPLGVKFYTGENFPEAYRGQLLIAEHGSWNRSEKSGYRITRVTLDGNEATAYEPFVTGFHSGEEVYGRPVDLLVLDDGSLLVSDDHAGAIYRIRYRSDAATGGGG
jgi:glucose/arabinose dehydrogenase